MIKKRLPIAIDSRVHLANLCKTKSDQFITVNIQRFRYLYLFLLIPCASHATELTGLVIDEGMNALPGVTLHVKGTNLGDITNGQGRYSIHLDSGNYTLAVSSLGYIDQEISIHVSETDKQQLDITLKESVDRLEAVTITASSIKATLESKGFAMKAVDMKDAELSSIQATDILDRTSGVRIRQSGGMGSRTRFNINGLSGNAIRVFIDGVLMQSYGPSFSLSSIPTNMIERIEVYKGVVPVELASDALGGAINIILKKNYAQNTLNTSYSFGSFNTHQFNTSGSLHRPKSGFTLKGSAFYNYSDNNYKVWGNQVYTTEPTTGEIAYVKATRFHDTYSSAGGKVDVGVTGRSWADELLFGMVLSEMSRDIQHGATMESVYGNRRATQNTQLASLSFKDKSFLSEKLSLEAFTSVSNLNRHIIDTSAYIFDWDGKRKARYDKDGNRTGWYEYISGAEAGNPTLQKSKENVFVGRAVSHFQPTDQHKFTTSFLHTGFVRDSEDPLRHVDIRDLEDTRYSSKTIVGLSYEYQAFQEKLKLSSFYKRFTQAVRVVEYKISGDDEVELNRVRRAVNADGFGFSAAYEILPKILLLSSAERSFRLPVAHELFGNLAESLEPNYDLNPEKSKNLNIGFTLGAFTFGKHEAKLQLNTFWRDTKDKIKRNVREDDTDETTEYINDDSYLSRGLDLDVFYAYNGKIHFNGNMSVFNSRFNTEFDENGLQYDWYRDRERNAPFFTTNSNLKYHFENVIQSGSKASIATNLAYVHWFYRDWESLGGAGKDIIPAQTVLDVSITYTFPDQRITLSLDGRNLLDDQVFDNYALQKPGRALYGKINLKIL
ncbi:TonB-dependent receptor [Marinoscillum furvescens]|uniref:Outer membrane receptor protein involved in Fe transport n=1 Tax=Marinoscillum furvescens DSM 4134 TaxID=1122208 RepID=A0A3D9L058_MARFU|nr:TonB-dependent receptor [Marinoscillum furvescens]RED96576.1 outer membrane receptor protein involved in Fe transport [Marinoscillum furvescens DSM 4134]